MAATSTSGTVTKLDIIKFAKDLLAEVEGIRSYLPAFNDETQQLSDQRPTESKVNAFFRLVGFPMFVSVSQDNDKDKSSGSDSGQMVMTPGYQQGEFPYGIVADSKETMLIGLDGKTNDAQTLLQAREKKLLEREQEVGTAEMNTRMASAFYEPLGLVLNENKKDSNGSKMFKRISPFAVSYSQIFPAQNELSKPFLANPEHGRPPPSSTPIRRPFIETVIRLRMVALEGGNQEQQDYLKTTDVQVAKLSSQVAKLLPKEASIYEAFIIDQMIGALDQIADRWVMLQNRKERLSKDIIIALKPKTSSAKRSVFGKQGNFALELKLKDNTATGQRLTDLNRAIAISEAMIGLLPTDDVTNLTTGIKTQNVMPNALTNIFMSILRQPLEQQKKKLEELNGQIEVMTQRADRIRLEMEMMTGEFTGLSLPDVVFTILGLFLIDREDLIAMLDSSTKDQMKNDKVLKTVLKKYDKGIAATEAIVNFENGVKALYAALETVIEARSNRNKRTGKSSTPVSSTEEGDEGSQDNANISDYIAKFVI